MSLSLDDRRALAEAKALLTRPGFAVQVADLMGTPIELGFQRLPDGWKRKVGDMTQAALMRALKVALLTMNPTAAKDHPGWHKVGGVVSGAVGGAFGLAGLSVELPISTAVICRSIADTARANGESLEDPLTRMACLEVFALGGLSKQDDAADAGYFATRAVIAKSVSDAAQYLASHRLVGEAAPAIVRLVVHVAARFQVQVSQKVAAQAVPLIGAAGGALVNLLFVDHFQQMSRGHFTIRRLERQYGAESVRNAFDTLEVEP